MKSRFLIWAACLLLTVSCGTVNKAYLVQGGQQVLQAAMITDDEIRTYVHQYVSQTDASSQMGASDNNYTQRLRKLTAGLTDIDGVPLNFEVYITNDVNAFACADGSVRVYSGLMDLMNDNEVLGVIGHEIGHVALKHTKKAMQMTLLLRPSTRLWRLSPSPSSEPSDRPFSMRTTPGSRRHRPTITPMIS